MFTPKKKSRIDIEIDKLVLALNDHPTNSKEYGETVNRLSQLHKIREESRPDRLSWNTGATIVAHLIGIAMITTFEHENIITSKAIGFIPKLR